MRLNTSFPVIDHKLQYTLLVGILIIAGLLRLYGISNDGVVYHDDLRAYVGVDIIQRLTSHDAPLGTRISDIYRIAIGSTGGRPFLAWFVSFLAMLGLESIGSIYIAFALCGVLSVYLVWVFCNQYFGPFTAIFASLWLAVNVAHVNFSRSALPPVPAMDLIILGIFLIYRSKGLSKKKFNLGVFLAGGCFASSMAFHPAYLVYLSIPFFLLIKIVLDQDINVGSFFKKMSLYSFLLISPTVFLLILHDAPIFMSHLFNGKLEISSLIYFKELWRLSHSATIYSSVNEGFLFWPKYLFAAEGTSGFFIIIVCLLLSFTQIIKSESVYLVLIWVFVPTTIFSLWPNLNSYGRLFAPTLPGIACLVGIGLSTVMKTILRKFPTRSSAVLISLVLLLFGGGGYLILSIFCPIQGESPI